MMPFSAIPLFFVAMQLLCRLTAVQANKFSFLPPEKPSAPYKKACHPAAFSAAGRQAFCLSNIRVKRVFAYNRGLVCSFRCCKPSVIFRCSHGLAFGFTSAVSSPSLTVKTMVSSIPTLPERDQLCSQCLDVLLEITLQRSCTIDRISRRR